MWLQRRDLRRDARRLARLLHIGELGGIRVPTVAEEDARDLVRAREAARAEVMRARHRASKLLLRHGIVYSGGDAWTAQHERWLRQQRFELPGTRAAFDEAFDAVLTVTARRDRRSFGDHATSAFALVSGVTQHLHPSALHCLVRPPRLVRAALCHLLRREDGDDHHRS